MGQPSLHRLLTRSDLDGLICAVLIKYLGLVEVIELVDHPSQMQAREIEVKESDITTNLPYVPGVGLAIDHHFSEMLRNKDAPGHVIDPEAPSAARVVYNHFGGRSRFPAFFDEMMDAVDKADSGQFTRDEILRPRGWPLLNFLVDQRTGIEQWGRFRIPEKRFKLDIIDYCLRMSINEILEVPDVEERVEVYFAYEKQFREQIRASATREANVIVLDFRDVEAIYPGNRFIVYALYPQCNISVLIRRDTDSSRVTFSVGKSIINPTAAVNIGELMLRYSGGGHRAAGACHVEPGQAGRVYRELLEALCENRGP
jgi:nanoRNase/pAp phosphatase (c-di-AMP/oligoRNAs hydrolase)